MTGMGDLDDIFGAARGAEQPSGALVARVLADADAAMPRTPVPEAVPESAPRWRRLVARFGGGAVIAGLASAAMAGVVIGYAGPVTPDWLAGSGPGIEVTVASDLFLGEG